MLLNRAHPQFDLSMELLCLLRVAPRVAKLDDLAEDLELKRHRDVRELAHELEKHGVFVANGVAQHKSDKHNSCHGLMIDRACGQRAKSLCESYFDTVYPVERVSKPLPPPAGGFSRAPASYF